MNQTFVCCSTYHVYISILEAYKFKKQGFDSLLIIFDDLIEGIEDFIANVADIGIFVDVLSIKGYTIVRGLKKNYGFIRYFGNRAELIVEVYEKHNPSLVRYDSFIENSEINLFQINRTRAFFLIKYKNNFFRMYEDGIGTYSQKMPILRYINRKYITRVPLLKGHDPQVKEVLVSYPEQVVDKVLIPKLKKLNIWEMEDNIDQADKEKIFSCLAGNITLNPTDACLIITQPLSEDRICSEAVKIELYEEIIMKELKSGNIVYLKTHPREITKYPFKNDRIILLPKYFPMEVFNLMDKLKIEKAISFFSTALYNLRHVDEKVLLGEDYLKKEIAKRS